MRFDLTVKFCVILFVLFGCTREKYIRMGNDTDYKWVIMLDKDIVDQGDGTVIVTAYKTEVQSIDGRSRRKGMVDRFKITKALMQQLDAEWKQERSKTTNELPIK